MMTIEEETTEPTEERFVLDSEEKVNWLLRKLATIDSERRRVSAQCQAILAALDTEEKSLRFRFEDDLRAFAAMKLAEGGNRKKTLHLLQGSLSFRTVAQAVKVVDTVRALEFAKVTGIACIETVTQEKLDATAYRERAEAVLKETGEILPGADVVPEREVFAIKFGKGEE